MSADRLSNALYRHAATLDAQQSQPRLGTIASIDPVTHSARVMIQPEGVLSGWLPMGSPSIGITAPYNQGDQVIVVPTQGSIEHGVILAAIYSDQQQPPQLPPSPDGQPSNTEAGGWAIVRNGASMRFSPDGSIIVTAPTNFVGNMMIKGTLHVTGQITSDADVVAQGKSLVHHTHTDSKGGITSQPN